MNYKFKPTEVKAVVDFAKKHNADVAFVQDHGTYLVSMTDPELGKRKVAYAKGYDPSKDEDFFHHSDDCCERLPASDFVNIFNSTDKPKEIIVAMTETHIRLRAIMKRGGRPSRPTAKGLFNVGDKAKFNNRIAKNGKHLIGTEGRIVKVMRTRVVFEYRDSIGLVESTCPTSILDKI